MLGNVFQLLNEGRAPQREGCGRETAAITGFDSFFLKDIREQMSKTRFQFGLTMLLRQRAARR